MSGRVAIVGWGSLIWDLDDLAPHVRGDWRMGAGPSLPMEFSRVSPKRLMGLVVILDPEHGTPCPTHWIASAKSEVAAAAEDLARRERCKPGFIGAVCRDSGFERGREAIVEAVGDWCDAEGLTGAVWTELLPNFAEVTGGAYGIASARAYLETLSGANLAEAVRYIENAPAATDTPLRRALAADPWWRDQAARHRAAGLV